MFVCPTCPKKMISKSGALCMYHVWGLKAGIKLLLKRKSPQHSLAIPD